MQLPLHLRPGRPVHYLTLSTFSVTSCIQYFSPSPNQWPFNFVTVIITCVVRYKQLKYYLVHKTTLSNSLDIEKNPPLNEDQLNALHQANFVSTISLYVGTFGLFIIANCRSTENQLCHIVGVTLFINGMCGYFLLMASPWESQLPQIIFANYLFLDLSNEQTELSVRDRVGSVYTGHHIYRICGDDVLCCSDHPSILFRRRPSKLYQQ